MLDWKISVGAIAGILISGILGNYLIKLREQNKEIVKFKQSFVAYLKALENPDANPTLLLLDNYPKQDESARKLVLNLSRRKSENFLNIWGAYSNFYMEKKGTRDIATVATEVDDISKADLSKPGAIKYIYQQTEKRRINVISLVNNALNTL